MEEAEEAGETQLTRARHIKKRSLKNKALSVSFDEKDLRYPDISHTHTRVYATLYVLVLKWLNPAQFLLQYLVHFVGSLRICALLWVLAWRLSK